MNAGTKADTLWNHVASPGFRQYFSWKNKYSKTSLLKSFNYSHAQRRKSRNRSRNLPSESTSGCSFPPMDEDLVMWSSWLLEAIDRDSSPPHPRSDFYRYMIYQVNRLERPSNETCCMDRKRGNNPKHTWQILYVRFYSIDSGLERRQCSIDVVSRKTNSVSWKTIRLLKWAIQTWSCGFPVVGGDPGAAVHLHPAKG